MNPMRFFTYALFLSLITLPAARAQLLLDAEGGGVVPGYNNIRIPGKGGTGFDATGQLDADPQVYYRLRAGYRFNDRHNVFVLYAPLKVNYAGQFDRNIRFFNEDFLPGVPVALTYVFNSYRLTYRYDFVRSDRLRIGAGLTAKIRDAYIEVTEGARRARKTNVGFVPLINVYFDWRFSERVGLLVEGDGLASPQGRAFDFEVALPVELTDALRLRLGYRFLEGGADNDEVYNFTLLHYGVLGLSYNF